MSQEDTKTEATATPLDTALLGHEPTGQRPNGSRIWRTFESIEQWVNKASTWMHPGDVCFDADGKPCLYGRDMMIARYPVTIARPS